MLKLVLSTAILTTLVLMAQGQRPIITYTTAKTPTAPPRHLPRTSPKSVTASTSPAPTMGNLTFLITGSQIPTSDTTSKVDGFVTVYSRMASAGGEVELGSTEVIDNNDNPEWQKVFWIMWKKGTGQKLRFVVQDHDTLGKNDQIAEAIIDLDEYVQNNQEKKVNLGPLTGTTSAQVHNPPGALTIKKTEPTKFKLYARNVPKKDSFGGKSDPYVEIYYRRGKKGVDYLLGTTAVLNDNENPDWTETFEFSNWQKGTDQYWFFKVQDQDSLSSSDPLGDLLVEVDPFVMRRQTKITKLENGDGVTTLGIVPA